VKNSAHHTTLPHPVALSIAGSDSGGGAGIQADCKTMTALGAFATSVITALTAQNGAGVLGIHEVPANFVLLQLQAVREGFPVKAAKTGMLASASIVNALADAQQERDFFLVVDPVCVSQSGCRLLREDAENAMRTRMIPIADVLTPNKPEAELLSGIRINSPEDVAKAAARLHSLGAKAVLIKGGHFENQSGQDMIDWFCMPGHSCEPMIQPRVDTDNNHGTGCTLSSAIAVYLAFGLPLKEAIRSAQVYLNRALAASFNPGIGAGPPNFMAPRPE
jgi:hydroxymethylpyrimidine/phosphomethylpyrimidine kinase